MTEKELKQQMKQIMKHDYKLDNGTYEEYAQYMLQYIGTTDSELRDDLIYIVFDKWIEDGMFSKEQLIEYLQICLDEEHSMFGLGKINKDSIFTRTFSALIIASILYKNNEDDFIDIKTMLEVKEKFLKYYVEEKDLRGYVDCGGWAHAVAHGADVLVQLAKYQGFIGNDMEEILEALQTKICQGEYVYIDREPERISVVVREIMNRKLIEETKILSWLEQFQADISEQNGMLGWYKRINKQNFLKTLYFALKIQPCNERYMDVVEKMISVL